MVHPVLYLANIIDYMRFFFMLLPIFMQDPVLCLVSFTVSDLLDMFDGYFARKLKQSSFLGACLDMSLDRASSTIISMKIICSKQVSLLIQRILILFVLIDLVSHWLRYSYGCKAQTHHKQVQSRFSALNFYYAQKVFMTFLCFAYEAFLLSTFWFVNGVQIQTATFVMKSMSAFAVYKVFLSVLQLIDSIEKLAEMDKKE
ncbi:CDP-diacylglycerol-inositol_3-phosphatidyltransferase [Hexamita inflata]|uniref:CDP-diacylglycerol-inositol 3-phosphatidyltransferase n=1 Tax=Hexamita inflata TaxID=28002 RepID=A0AA86PJ89_9EUKA|nr:CDP-diacylglycerol-inositol 3-phosphatidyltransferase [Hexamita inflata]